jgi:beta-lactam-binding protein with PASTA domain
MLLALQMNMLLAAGGPELVEVPDVVGNAQAAGTSTLEGAGFVVQVATANSSTVAAGDIISQQPLGGSSAPSGSIVVITVSLGEGQSGAGYLFDRRRGRR